MKAAALAAASGMCRSPTVRVPYADSPIVKATHMLNQHPIGTTTLLPSIPRQIITTGSLPKRMADVHSNFP